MPRSIIKFQGPYRFLSNFFETPIKLGDQTFPSLENAYQAAKTQDPLIREAFVRITASEAKRMGRSIHLRDGWEANKVTFMEVLLERKFRDPELREKLIATSQKFLIEGNTWHDNYWGICTCNSCPGTGENMLGNLLMDLRETIIEGISGDEVERIIALYD